jgi:DNA-binding NarL/FixJ family response regulator
MLLRRGRWADLTIARTLLEEAVAGYTALGMHAWADRTRAILTEPSPAARPAYPDGLTAREVEVLRLLAGGCSNRQIAAALVISVRTAENHIASIYSKTGAHGRAAAATYALTHALIPPGEQPDGTQMTSPSITHLPAAKR